MSGAMDPRQMFIEGMQVFGSSFINHGDWWELRSDESMLTSKRARPFPTRPASEQRRPPRKGRR